LPIRQVTRLTFSQDTCGERYSIFDEKPRIFIVHGHDLKAATDLRAYLRETLKFDQPIILKDQVSGGDTVIEKFEDFAEQSDIVFALFTPDDPGSSTGQARARQNVLFEFGFFIAKFGRKSGKVIFLCKKGVEIPSDLSGWIPIDISDGIWAASDEIRRELQEYLD
jgi:predicted nucleotide-binding protein